MNQNNVSLAQCISIIVLFIIGDSLAMPLGIAADELAFLSVYLTGFLVIPILIIYAKILEYDKMKGLYQLTIEGFGNKIGKLICLFYVFYGMMLWALIIKNQADFITTLTLNGTPRPVLIIMLTALNFFAFRKNMGVVGNVSQVLLNVMLVFIATAIILSFPQMSFEEIKALRDVFSYKDLGMGIFTLSAFPFTEIVLLVLYMTKANCNMFKRALVAGTVISGLLLGTIVLAEFLVLGSHIYNDSYYPIHAFTTKLSIGNYFKRSEIVALIIIVFGNFIKSTVCLYAVVKGVNIIFGFKRESTCLLPILGLLINMSLILTQSTSDMMLMAQIYPYFQLLLSMIIPIILLATLYIKKKRLDNL